MEDTLIAYGGEVKSAENTDDGGLRVTGYLVRFGSPEQPDISTERDFFTKATDFGEHRTTPVFFNHRLPLKTADGGAVVVKEKIGTGKMSIDDEGVLIDAIIYNADLYAQTLNRMGWSSGTAAHLVERKAAPNNTHEITTWLLGLDASITPRPAEPRNRVVSLKSLITEPAPQPAQIKQPEEAKKMSEIVELKGQVDAMSESLNQVLKALERIPGADAAGYMTNVGGAQDASHKSFADFLLAVKRQDTKRLDAVYGIKANTLTEGGGAQIGVMVPPEYRREILEVANAASPLLAAINRQPVMSPAGEIPALDQYVAPSAGVGASAYNAGMTAATRAESGSYTQTDLSMDTVSWRLTDALSGYVLASKELMEDFAGLEALLRRMISGTIASKLEYFVLRGSGVAQPLGLLNAPAAVGITPDTNSTFAYTDALEMLSRFKQVGGRPMWVVHPSLLPDIGAFQVSTGGASLVSALTAGMPMQILGYPVITSEHLPQADNSGCALLVDPSAYLLFEKPLYIDYSEHANFTTGKGTWRFGQRVDGKVWLKSAITLGDPQGSFTVSPVVYFND